MSKHRNGKDKPQNQPKQDNSPFVFQRDKVKEELTIRKPFEFTEKQKRFIEIALDKETKVILCKAPPGVGKTMLSVYCCLQLLNSKHISQILYLRNPIEASSRSLGALPGEKFLKMQAFGEPAFDHLRTFLNNTDLTRLEKEERLLVETIGFIQGRTYNSTGIIIDEIEDLTLKEIRMTLCRMGKFSKLFAIGDEFQSNIKNSGFLQVYNLFNNEESKAHGIHTFEFSKEDCMRSGIIKFVLEKLESLTSSEPMFK